MWNKMLLFLIFAFLFIPFVAYSAEEEPEDEPIGQSKDMEEDLFGRKRGYIHPFLSIAEQYDDNIFNTKDNKEGDFKTIISPGVWLSIPRIRERVILLGIETSSITPGGLTHDRFRPEFISRYQTYLFYRADIEQFSHNVSENTVNHRAEGLFQYNFRGGLSIDIADLFVRSHDRRGTGISETLDKYKTNLFHIISAYEVSRRTMVRIDYANFLVDYDDSESDFRDRKDNAFSGYIFYKFRPKTSAFIEYELYRYQL